MKEIYSKYNEQGKELEQTNRALAVMTEKLEEATKAAEESERYDTCGDKQLVDRNVSFAAFFSLSVSLSYYIWFQYFQYLY